MQLTVQLLELNQPIYIGLNMIDVATKRGIKIDYHKLMKKLKTPIFPVVARTGKGTKHLLGELKHLGKGINRILKSIMVRRLKRQLKYVSNNNDRASHDKYQARFIAIQFLLNNMQIANELNSEVVNKLSSLRDQVAEQVEAVSVRREMERIRNHYIETLLQDGNVSR